MEPTDPTSTDPRQAKRPQRLSILEMMVLVAGAALGIWLVSADVVAVGSARLEPGGWMLVIVGLLGGVSAVGVPLLLIELRRRRSLWGAGKVLWFSQGMASWLLWPPVIYGRIQGHKFGDSMAGTCYFYGTPLMAIYVTTALMMGGWTRKGRRRVRRLSWREQFGLLLGMLWACTGLYVYYMIVGEDFRR